MNDNTRSLVCPSCGGSMELSEDGKRWFKDYPIPNKLAPEIKEVNTHVAGSSYDSAVYTLAAVDARGRQACGDADA